MPDGPNFNILVVAYVSRVYFMENMSLMYWQLTVLLLDIKEKLNVCVLEMLRVK